MSIEGLTLTVRGVDLLDGTPVLDIKPYVAYTDAWPESRSGWLLEQPVRPGTTGRDPVARYEVTFEPAASGQLDWIAARSPLPFREHSDGRLRGPAAPSVPALRSEVTSSGSPCRWRIRSGRGERRRVVAGTPANRDAQLDDPRRTPAAHWR